MIMISSAQRLVGRGFKLTSGGCVLWVVLCLVGAITSFSEAFVWTFITPSPVLQVHAECDGSACVHVHVAMAVNVAF